MNRTISATTRIGLDVERDGLTLAELLERHLSGRSVEEDIATLVGSNEPEPTIADHAYNLASCHAVASSGTAANLQDRSRSLGRLYGVATTMQDACRPSGPTDRPFLFRYSGRFFHQALDQPTIVWHHEEQTIPTHLGALTIREIPEMYPSSTEQFLTVDKGNS